MELIQWHDSFSVGIKIIDDQHKQLFTLYNELVLMCEEEKSHSNLNLILHSLEAYTEVHFKTEEGLLAVHHDYQSHCDEHQVFGRKIKNFRIQDEENKASLTVNLVNEIKAWLTNHILNTDIAFFDELGFRQQEQLDNISQRLQLLSQKEKVLIVENDPTQRQMIKRNLDLEGFATLEATNGAEALKIIEDNFDLHLVITDLNMPVMDGFDLILSIREKKLSQIYIIVITIASDRQSLIKSFEYGANDYLSKPVFHQELFLRLKNGIRLMRLESQDDLIFSMAKLADCRSPETGQHLERVKEFTLLLARQLILGNPELGMTESIASDISKVSPLHDIGKVGIADGILNKPGKLTEEEFNTMKSHCKIGGDLISGILRRSSSRSLRLAFEITMYHHEKWDGSGYPLGLSGNDIPIAARIMALADVYDALTTKRIYKDAFSREQARQTIVAGSGFHFDPILIKAFEAIEEQFHQLRETLSD